MPLTKSWHVPRPIHSSRPEKIPVVFCQRGDTTELLEKLPSDIMPYPWIRDDDLQQDGLVLFLHRLKEHGHKSAIVVEGQDDIIVVLLAHNLAQRVPIELAVEVARNGFDELDDVGRIELPPLQEEPELQLKQYDLAVDFTDEPVVISIAGEYPGAIEYPLPRDELYDLFVHLEKQQKADLPLYIFVHDDFGLWAAARYDSYGNHCGEGISLLPVKDIQGLWQAAHNEERLASAKDQHKYGDTWGRERIQKRKHSHSTVANVYFLKDFTLDEQRDIRRRFSEPHEADDEERGHEFAYPGTFEGSINDLVQQWQRDPWQGYDRHFFAVGDVVYGASCLDLWHDTNELGWYYGTLEPRYAFCAWVNLDVANMGPAELFDDVHILWLDDLKEYSKDHPEGE